MIARPRGGRPAARAWPTARLSVGLLGRLLTILLLTVGVETALSAWLYERSARALVRDDEAHRLADHVGLARALVGGAAVPERPAMAERLSTGRYDIRWVPARAATVGGDPRLDPFRARVVRWDPALGRADLRLALVSVGRRARLVGAFRLPDGSWLRFGSDPPSRGGDALRRAVLALVPAALLLIVGAVMFRRTLRPMGMLARAAAEIGTDIGAGGPPGRAAALPESGPGEVARVIRAFNAMRARIHALIDERTQALAAVGHDLRTPLARMRLRADHIGEPRVRAAFEDDVAEMDGMVASLLAYLGGAEPEAVVRVDLAVIAATLADAAADMGHDVVYEGLDHLEAAVRPSGFRRALGNLIGNAVQYGGGATVSVAREADGLVVAVADRGPGIPEDRLAHVVAPFARLDHARARNTGGLGLGLAIVAEAAAMDGGALTLANRPGGGLIATIRLPDRGAARA